MYTCTCQLYLHNEESFVSLLSARDRSIQDVNMQHRPAMIVTLQASYEPAVVIETNHDSGASTA
jgi:hypothetical protein